MTSTKNHPKKDAVYILLSTSSNKSDLGRRCYVTLDDAIGEHFVMMESATMSTLMQIEFVVGIPFKKQEAGAMTTFILDANKDSDHIMVFSPAVYLETYQDKKFQGVTSKHTITKQSTVPTGERTVTWLTLTLA